WGPAGLDRRGQHDALNLGAAGGTKDAKCTVARRDDEFVRVARGVDANRSRDMEYIVATRDGSVPARVACKIGGSEGQSVAWIDLCGNSRANRQRFVQAAHRRANGIATLQQLNDGPAPDKAGSASY